MASSSFALDHFLDCYKPPRVPKPNPNPACTLTRYVGCPIKYRYPFLCQEMDKKVQFSSPLDSASEELDNCLKNLDKIIVNPGKWADRQSLTQQNFKFPCPEPPCPRCPSSSSSSISGKSECVEENWNPPHVYQTAYGHYYQCYPPPVMMMPWTQPTIEGNRMEQPPTSYPPPQCGCRRC